MSFVVFFTVLLFVAGLSSWLSSLNTIPPDVRKNLPPNLIEALEQEQLQQRYWGQLLMIMSALPFMMYLSYDL